MRITSPKSIPLRGSQIKVFSKDSRLSSKGSELGINTREAFHKHEESRWSSKLVEEYGVGGKGSVATQTFVSNNSGRSRSKHQGITTIRSRTIKVDNIYQPEHFTSPSNKAFQNASTKSISTSNRQTKSISRLTRATSPTITSYPQRKQSEHSNAGNTSLGTSVKQLNQSYGQDLFDFKDLKREIEGRGEDTMGNRSEDYYGLDGWGNPKSGKGQLTENNNYSVQGSRTNGQQRGFANSFYDSPHNAHKQANPYINDQHSTHTTPNRNPTSPKRPNPPNLPQNPIHPTNTAYSQKLPSNQQPQPNQTSEYNLQQTSLHRIGSRQNLTKPSSVKTNLALFKGTSQTLNQQGGGETYQDGGDRRLGWRDVVKK